MVLINFENKLHKNIPKCNDHLECEKYEKWNNIKNVLHVYVWNKMCNVQTMANIAISCKDIVEKTKRNIKKLFKNCVYEHIVWVHIYHQFNLGLRKVNQYNEGKSKMILYFYLYSPCFMHYYSNYLSSIDHKLSITTENSFSCRNWFWGTKVIIY